MRAKRDGKEGWISLCKGDVTIVSTERARRQKGEVTAEQERETDSVGFIIQLSQTDLPDSRID